MRHLDDFVATQHPLRPIRGMVSAVLGNMNALLSDIYEVDIERRMPKQKLLRDMLLQVFYRVCSER